MLNTETATSDRYTRRQARLMDLVRAHGGKDEFAYASGLPKAHIMAILTGERRMRDELASKLERLAGKPDGWMDTE